MPNLLDQRSKRQTVMICHLHCLTVDSKSPLLSVCGRDISEPVSLPLPGVASMGRMSGGSCNAVKITNQVHLYSKEIWAGNSIHW